MRRFQATTVVIAGLLFLQACSGPGPTAPSAEQSPASQATDNFYRYINRDWLAQTEIPADRAGITNFVIIQDTVHDRLKQLVLNLPNADSGSPEQAKIAALHDSYNDLPRRKQLGVGPIRGELKAIGDLDSHRDIARMFARLQRQGVTVPWVGFVGADYQDSNRNIVHLAQAGLSIDRDYYLGTDARSVQQREYLQSALAQLLALAGFTDTAAMATDVIALEAQLARIQNSKVDNRDVEATYNITTLPQLAADTPELYTGSQLMALGIAGDYPINVMQPDYLQQLRRVFDQTTVADWRKYLSARVVLHYAELLSDDFTAVTSAYDIQRGLYDVRPPQWQLAIAYLNDYVGMLLGQLYVEAFFEDRIKTDVTAMVDAIKEEYRLAILKSDRLGPATRRSAMLKLDKMAFHIGYPDQWQDYSSLQIDGRDLVGNHRRIAEYEHRRNIAKLGQAVDRQEWAVPPQEVNAFYNPGTNTFVLLAGILTEPFYSADADLAANYGGIGLVIGHEIGHGFDDQGSRFDADGNLANWWSEDDARRFRAIRQQLIEQANGYEILPGHRINGELAIGEIIGDLSGTEIALRAFTKQLNQQGTANRGSSIEGFLARIALTWRSKIRPEVMLNLLQADPHPPAEYRTNGTVKNLDAFHETYRTRPGDGMYLAPSERVNIW